MNYRDITPTHLALGTGRDISSACGLAGLWHRGLKSTMTYGHVSCKKCRRWMVKNKDILLPIKNVTP